MTTASPVHVQSRLTSVRVSSTLLTTVVLTMVISCCAAACSFGCPPGQYEASPCGTNGDRVCVGEYCHFTIYTIMIYHCSFYCGLQFQCIHQHYHVGRASVSVITYIIN